MVKGIEAERGIDLMEISKVTGVYFSPTGSTRKVLGILTEEWKERYCETDLTDLESEGKTHEFGSDELVYFGVPSYGGRVPDTAVKRLEGMKGNVTPAVIVVTFGNRAYEDTLLELKNLVQKNGFQVVGAAAVVTEHSILHQFATGRPDEEDYIELVKFAGRICNKVHNIVSMEDVGEVTVKGNEPYKEYHVLPTTPKGGSKCKGCGICVKKCPMGAISSHNPRETDETKCISCMRCVQVCPEHARSVNKILLTAAGVKLKKACSERKNNEFVL